MKIIEIKPIVWKILIAIAVLLLILLMTLCFLETAHSRADIAKTQAFDAQVIANYKANVDKKTDAYLLTKNGLRQLDINLPNLALISLTRATEINQNYRDAHLALGLAQLKTNDIKAALTSFQTAERLDPIYAKTYELLKIAYEKLEDGESAQKAEEKYKFLVHSE